MVYQLLMYTISEFIEEFPDEEACLQDVWRKKDISCCGRLKRVEKAYYCTRCKKHYSILKDTIFARSSTSLWKWYYAIFLFSNTKSGVSAKDLQRHLGVTYKTAWRMGHKIRELMTQKAELSGVVEIDEAYIGRKRPKAYQGKSLKKPVLGMVQRDGKARAQVMDSVKTLSIIPVIRDSIKQGTHIMTDEYGIYNTLKYEGYTHDRVKHGAWEFARDDVHINTTEGFWGHVKSSLNGTYRAVSHRHLQAYLDERVWHWNHRQSPHRFEELLGRLHG